MVSESAYPVDIAARAASLDEREHVVAALGDPGDTQPLTAFDSWNLDRLATRLAGRFRKETVRRPGPPRHTVESLAGTLTAYRRHELALPGCGDRLGPLLTELHHEWLPTYQATLDRFDPAEAAEASWREPEVYYGRLAIACEPFLLELGRRLSPALCGPSAPRIDPTVIDDLQRHLLDRFELALAWAVETDAKVHCRLQGVDPTRASHEDYIAYLDKTFADAGSYHRFYLEFPVLGRWLAHVTDMLAEGGVELITRLRADADEVAGAFFTEPIMAVRSLRPGRSDFHASARSVTIIEVELAGGTRERVVYKPRCVEGEAAFQGLVRRLRQDGVLDYAERAVLPKDGYGYEALIPPERNRVSTREDAEHVYAELGGYLAIFYILGGGDLHFENIIVADGHAFICDCETVLGALPKGQPRPTGTLMDSVFKTGLIEWPTAPSADRGETAQGEAGQGEAGQGEAGQGEAGQGGMKISGYSGGDAYELPMPVPLVDNDRMSFAATVTHHRGVRVEPGAANRVFIGDHLTRPEDFIDHVTAGFDRVYRWFHDQPERAATCVRELFAAARVRFVNWSTQVYTQLLAAARHPKCLMEALEVDLLFNTVRTFPRKWDGDGVLPAWELASMWRQDVPLFTVDAAGDEFVHDHRSAVEARLQTSPLGLATARIGHLSPDNRAQQHQYITAGLSGGQVTSPEFTATCLQQAAGLGLRLCRALRDPDAPAPWISYMNTADGKVEVDIEGDLYNGSAGIALFLAHLDALDPHPEFHQAARRALDHALTVTDRHRIGAFGGVGGLIYLLTHLHHLWDERALLDRALDLADDLAVRIDHDRHLDVFHGVAGLIPVLLGLARTADGRGLDLAHRFATHLLGHAEADGDTLSWPNPDPATAQANLTGLSHGAGGVGWALIALGRHTDRPDYVSAGRRAFAYEARHFDQTEQDWYDLRTFGGGASAGGRHYANAWCNGAAGIGLTRIESWALLGGDDETLLQEAHQALTATIRNFPKLRNDTLCHGRSGNAELYMRFAALKNEPAFRLEANVQVQGQWRNLDDARPGSESGFFPGLMLGMAGFGMHFLRLARPELVPSVLLLDPPASTSRQRSHSDVR